MCAAYPLSGNSAENALRMRSLHALGPVRSSFKDMDDEDEQSQVAALARQIRVELAARSMLHQDLADAIPVSHSTMSNYMTAQRSIPMPTFFRIAEVLEVEPSVLLQRASELPPDR